MSLLGHGRKATVASHPALIHIIVLSIATKFSKTLWCPCHSMKRMRKVRPKAMSWSELSEITLSMECVSVGPAISTIGNTSTVIATATTASEKLMTRSSDLPVIVLLGDESTTASLHSCSIAAVDSSNGSCENFESVEGIKAARQKVAKEKAAAKCSGFRGGR